MDAEPVTLTTGCKINLFLRVLGRRADGYHDIESLFLPLDAPSDEISVTPRAGDAPGTVRTAFFAAGADGRPCPPLADINPEKNTLTKACSLFAEASGFAPALDIRVTKGVPQGAGLGGGSANAATLLLYLQKTAKQAGIAPLSDEALTALAARVGADVPFFLLGGPALVRGIGEKLSPCPSPFPGRYLLLVCPEIFVSTAWAFHALDSSKASNPLPAPDSPPAPPKDDAQNAPGNRDQKKKNVPGLLTSEEPRASKSLAQAQDFANDFEDLVFARFPELARLHGLLVDSGAELARMSGTGASLFALYREKRIAEKAAKKLAKQNVSVYTQRLPAG